VGRAPGWRRPAGPAQGMARGWARGLPRRQGRHHRCAPHHHRYAVYDPVAEGRWLPAGGGGGGKGGSSSRGRAPRASPGAAAAAPEGPEQRGGGWGAAACVGEVSSSASSSAGSAAALASAANNSRGGGSEPGSPPATNALLQAAEPPPPPPRWRRDLATAATFLVSGLEHEVFHWWAAGCGQLRLAGQACLLCDTRRWPCHVPGRWKAHGGSRGRDSKSQHAHRPAGAPTCSPASGRRPLAPAPPLPRGTSPAAGGGAGSRSSLCRRRCCWRNPARALRRAPRAAGGWGPAAGGTLRALPCSAGHWPARKSLARDSCPRPSSPLFPRPLKPAPRRRTARRPAGAGLRG
jgi:hypothetical protein